MARGGGKSAALGFLWHVANLLTCCEMPGSCQGCPLEFLIPLPTSFLSGNGLDFAERQNLLQFCSVGKFGRTEIENEGFSLKF